MKIARNLLKKIEEGCFEVYLQSKFELQAHRMIGAKALIRKRLHRDILEEFSCGYGQGYYASKPRSFANFRNQNL